MIGRLSFRSFFAVLAFAASAVAVLPSAAQAQTPASPREGTEYIRLQQPQPNNAGPGKIEVIEFFWYSCPHCNALEPSFEDWAKKLPADVVLHRVPVRFNAGMEAQQKLYYTLEALNKVDAFQRKVFDAIHVQQQQLTTPDRIIDWAVKQGFDKAQFTATYNSFGVAAKVKGASKMAEDYHIDGVPTLAVNGRFITSPSQTGSNEGALQVVNYLIAQARSGK